MTIATTTAAATIPPASHGRSEMLAAAMPPAPPTSSTPSRNSGPRLGRFSFLGTRAVRSSVTGRAQPAHADAESAIGPPQRGQRADGIDAMVAHRASPDHAGMSPTAQPLLDARDRRRRIVHVDDDRVVAIVLDEDGDGALAGVDVPEHPASMLDV